MGYIVLQNVDPEQRKARYYALTWSPAITGSGWAVERAWGPLHARRRQHRTTVVAGRAAALDLAAHHLRRRLRHGYALRGADRDGQALVAARFSTEEDA